MAAKVNIAKHPVHPMLVPFPIGLWVFSLVSDIIYMATGNVAWLTVAFYSMAGGIVGAVAAAIPGLIDWMNMKPLATKRVGTTHMILNVSALTLYLINFFIRYGNEGAQTPFTFILSIIGVGIIGFSGWLGGTMVYEHGAAVVAVEAAKPEVEREHLRKAA